jgi:hypothetical protein
MIQYKTTLKLDLSKVGKAVDRKNRTVLRAVGAFTRTKIKSRMRPGGKGGKVSNEGEYPRAHGNQLLRKLVLYDVDMNSGSVAIGPKAISRPQPKLRDRVFRRGRRSVIRSRVRSTMPAFINEGGAAEKLTETLDGTVTRVPIQYGPRPFVALATPEAMDELREKTKSVELK